MDDQEFRHPGRWIMSPKRGSGFVGRHARTRLRARDRRRQVYVFLLEAIGLTGLMGLFPPLRGMLVISGFLAALLVAYTAMVIQTTRTALVRREARPADPGDVVVVLPEARPEPEFDLEERDPHIVRIAAR